MSTGLDSQPSATTYDVEGLVTAAWAGRIRVPHFQRGFKWGRRDVIHLFDSILRGYPIGSLLLWVRAAPEQDVTLGTVHLRAPELQDALWVVDGQQRVASLASALHESGATDQRFALAYDLRGRTFVPLPAQQNPWLIPLPVLFDLRRLIRWFADNPDVADRLDEASAVTRTIRQFTVPAYQVVQGDERVLQDIFDRMNNYGKRLSRAEVFSALHAGEESTRDGRLTIELIAERINAERGFGPVDDDTVLRAILARRGPDVMREIRTEFDDDRRGQVDFPGEDRDTAYEAGEEALRRAVVFLQEHAGVPHVSFLPYRYLLVVLSRFFAHHPDPVARNLQLLRRWFWRAAVTGPGVFPGGTTGGTRILCAQIRPDDATASVQRLLQTVDVAGPPRMPSLDRFRTNSAETKIVLCSWWARGPRSRETGEIFDRSDLARGLAERTTAADVVVEIFASRHVPPRHRAGAANRILRLSEEEKEEKDTFPPSPSMDPQTQHAYVTSHCLPEAFAARLTPDGGHLEWVGAFLDARRELLAGALREFLDRMCEWRFEDTPPLDDLILDDVDDADDVDGRDGGP